MTDRQANRQADGEGGEKDAQREMERDTGKTCRDALMQTDTDIHTAR